MDAATFYKSHIEEWPKTQLIQHKGVYYKLEDENVTGSVKSRGMCWQVHDLLTKGVNHAVISSSGNAAVAFAYYCKEAGITAYVFVPINIESYRLERLQRYTSNITRTADALNKAQEFAREKGFAFVRQSTDDNATKGYEGLYDELSLQLRDQNIRMDEVSIFFPVSSGTTVAGFYTGAQKSGSELFPQIHIVQSQAVHPLAYQFDFDVKRKSQSVVTGIVARETERGEFVVNVIHSTGGSGWVVPDTLVRKMHHELEAELRRTVSMEGALARAGLEKARQKNFALKKYSVVMLT